MGDKITREGIKVKCNSCGHSWYYFGRMSRATCSNCSSKTKVDGGGK